MKLFLIIEDDPAEQFLNQVIFSNNHPSIEVLLASDGEEAIQIIKEKNISPDLILLDINMPRMNGHEFLEKFTDKNTRDIPIIVMLTSSDQEQDKESAFGYKCVKDYLLKPMSEEKAAKLIELSKA